LQDYLEATRHFPEWTDPVRVGHIADFYAQHKRTAGAVQGTAGLIGTYLSPIGAKTLHATHSLDHPARRLAQSTRLFVGMGDPDAFTEHSMLIPTCQKVRLVHAAVRQLLVRSGTWDNANDGEPVSQLYAYEAALIFSVGTLDAMTRLGVTLTEEQQDGFYYAWKLISYWLGIPESPVRLPDSVEEAHALWNEARDGGAWGPTQDGVILTAGCIQLYESKMPPGLKGFIPGFIRRILTDQYADMVGVPRSEFEHGLGALSALKERLTGKHKDSHDISRDAIDALGAVVEGVSRDVRDERGKPTTEAGLEPQMPDQID
jgi:uncharacterized protein (DUF2236 family)